GSSRRDRPGPGKPAGRHRRGHRPPQADLRPVLHPAPEPLAGPAHLAVYGAVRGGRALPRVAAVPAHPGPRGGGGCPTGPGTRGTTGPPTEAGGVDVRNASKRFQTVARAFLPVRANRPGRNARPDRKSTRLNSSHLVISY